MAVRNRRQLKWLPWKTSPQPAIREQKNSIGGTATRILKRILHVNAPIIGLAMLVGLSLNQYALFSATDPQDDSKSIGTSFIRSCHQHLEDMAPRLRLLQAMQNNASAATATDNSKTGDDGLHDALSPPRVCIIITTYNVADYVSESMDSALGQTYQNLEIIVVDDNSNDGTPELILEKYGADYMYSPKKELNIVAHLPTVQVVRMAHTTNGGAGQPSNIGMDTCSDSAQYVMFLDGDDFMHRNAVETLLRQAQRYKADVVMGDFVEFTITPSKNNGTNKMNMETIQCHDYNHWITIPQDTSFNIITHPRLLRTSPVPWRKLYKRDMLEKYNLRFQEGDYFFEDNGFHWNVLTHAAICRKVDRVLFYHRRARQGQTSIAFDDNSKSNGASALSMEQVKAYSAVSKLSGYFPNLHQIGRKIFPEHSDKTTIFDSSLVHKVNEETGETCVRRVYPVEIARTYLEWLDASRWIAKKQLTPKLTEKFFRIFDLISQHWLQQDKVQVPKGYWESLNQTLSKRRAKVQRTFDLSIIIPTFNVHEFIHDTLVKLYNELNRPGFTFEVFMIDDGSQDKTQQVLLDFAKSHDSNFYVMATPGRVGAGKARNLVLPLVEGRYVYTADSDDSFDFAALADAVDFATKFDKDLLILPYNVEYVTTTSSTKSGMMSADERTWNKVRRMTLPTHMNLKEEALHLIAYPWKQLTSRKLLWDTDAYFLPTAVNDDLWFHWATIAGSKNIHFYHKEICTHRKFDSSVRGQMTTLMDERLAVLAATGMTQRALTRSGYFKGDFGTNVLFRKCWAKSVHDLLNWAKRNVPESMKKEYEIKSKRFLAVVDNKRPKLNELGKWPYWGDYFATRNAKDYVPKSSGTCPVAGGYGSLVEPDSSKMRISKRALRKKSPRVCVVVTTYNVANYVETALNSVLNQTYQNLEIILVDDNSNDGTAELVLNHYATEGPTSRTATPTLQLIHLAHNTIGGTGQPSNIGIESCSSFTDYVMFLDGDDHMENDAVEVLLRHAEPSGADIVMADFDLFTSFPNGTVQKYPSYDHSFWKTIPNTTLFNLKDNPEVLKLAPVPWRKLYRRDLIRAHKLRFPEGDYFFEDNAFHYKVTVQAKTNLKVDKVLFHHRRGRKDQTSSSFDNKKEGSKRSIEWVREYSAVAKLGGHFPNFYKMGQSIFSNKIPTPKCSTPTPPFEVVKSYFRWLYDMRWIAKRQGTKQLREKFYRVLDSVSRHWPKANDIQIPEDFWESLKDSIYQTASEVRDVDLSIIIPVLSVHEFIHDTLVKLYNELNRPGFTFEVFVIDDGSESKTQQVMLDFAKTHDNNFYFMATPGNVGAGKARNLVLPLVEGRYVYTADSDDSFDFAALADAVDFATKFDKDLLILPYSIEYWNNTKTGMTNADERTWKKARNYPLRTHMNQKEAALELTAYPWKQLTSRKLLWDTDAYFLPTIVNDCDFFHWGTVVGSTNIHFYHKAICTHRIFETKDPVKDDRLAVLAALGMTQRALARNGGFDGKFGSEIVFSKWRFFVQGTLSRAKVNIPESSVEEYGAASKTFLDLLNRKSKDYPSLEKWSYWGERFLRRPLMKAKTVVQLPDAAPTSIENQQIRSICTRDLSTHQVKTNSKVCVVVATYNRMQHLEMVVDSILQQSHKKMEIVLVDDGSSDSSITELSKMSTKDKNVFKDIVKLRVHTSQGQAYNIGMTKCSSDADYVLLNDGAVTLEKEALSSLVKQAEVSGSDAVLATFDGLFNAEGGESGVQDERTFMEHVPGYPFDVVSVPTILRITPAPWRTLYRKEFLASSDVEFHETYYGNSDASFHWQALMMARRISNVKGVLFHRVGEPDDRTPQVVLSGLIADAYNIGRLIFSESLDGRCIPAVAIPAVAKQYFDLVKSYAWLVKEQESPFTKMLFQTLLDKLLYQWPSQSHGHTGQAYWESLGNDIEEDFPKEVPSVDLTIIMPAYNVGELIQDLLKSMFHAFRAKGVTFELFAINDFSTDSTYSILKKEERTEEGSLVVMNTTQAQGGAGRARNVAIPLISGSFVFFVDADDLYDFEQLVDAVKYAKSNHHDVLIFPYEMATQFSASNKTVSGMMKADNEIWKKLYPDGTQRELQRAALGLINFPWKQLTATSLVRDNNIYFGPTKVHNDVQFHWLSIAAAKNIHFYKKVVTTHRLFDASFRGQLTNEKSSARMNIFDSFGMTQRALARLGAFDGGRQDYPYTVWLKFCRDVLNWASQIVPDDLLPNYKRRWKFMLASLKDEALDPKMLGDWPYWEEPPDKEK